MKHRFSFEFSQYILGRRNPPYSPWKLKTMPVYSYTLPANVSMSGVGCTTSHEHASHLWPAILLVSKKKNDIAPQTYVYNTPSLLVQYKSSKDSDVFQRRPAITNRKVIRTIRPANLANAQNKANKLFRPICSVGIEILEHFHGLIVMKGPW